MITQEDISFLKKAIDLALTGLAQDKGGPFGCVIVKNGEVVGKGYNSVTSMMDPTAHAEIVAIRDACKKLGEYQLNDCTLYTSCEPCPMCLGAIYWARPSRVIYAATRDTAAEAGFDDALIYKEITLTGKERKIPFECQQLEEAFEPFSLWNQKEKKDLY